MTGTALTVPDPVDRADLATFVARVVQLDRSAAVLLAASGAVKIPIIASGGAGKLEHFYDALTIGGASAVLAASLFHFGELSLFAVKNYLSERGVLVR